MNKSDESFYGAEYLGLYYYITVGTSTFSNKEILWIMETATRYITFDGWLDSNLLPKQR